MGFPIRVFGLLVSKVYYIIFESTQLKKIIERTLAPGRKTKLFIMYKYYMHKINIT